MSWTNCSLGSIFSSPDLWGLLHAGQFLTGPDKAHILKLDLSFHYPSPCDLYWATSSSILSPASFRVALVGSTIVLRLQVQIKDHFLEPLDPLQSHCLSEGLPQTPAHWGWPDGKQLCRRGPGGPGGHHGASGASNVPLQQTRPTTSRAVLGRALAACWGRWSFSGQHWWDNWWTGDTEISN